MAYRFVQPSAQRRQATSPRLVARIEVADLLAAAVEYFGYDAATAQAYLLDTARRITREWRSRLADEGAPPDETRRFEHTFAFATSIAEHGIPTW